MLWKTHIRISNEVLRRLNVNLPSDVYSKFKEGLLAPDQWRDSPHHHGKSGAIQTNLQYARQYFLQSKQQEAFYYLGVAMHYIQDAYTSIISYDSPHNQEWHHNYEQGIENSDFVYNIDNTLQYFFQNDNYQFKRFSSIASQLSKKVEGKYETLRIATLVGDTPSKQTGKPKVDLNLALKACIVVTESVISPKNYSQLDLAIKSSLGHHQHLLFKVEADNSSQIIDSANQLSDLKSKKMIKPGFVARVKNGILTIRVKVKGLQLNRQYNRYVQKKHLHKVNSMYENHISAIVSPYVGWYNYFVPKLDFEIVKKEIVPLQQVSETFGIEEEAVAELVNCGKIKICTIGNNEVVFRKELNQILG